MAEKLHYMGDGNLGQRGGRLYVFHCPGCGYGHPFEVGAPNGEGWTWNGSFAEPTFSPSLLVNRDYPAARCHSFVENGKIRFLDDCFHELKGRVVDLPDWE
jgi:hypothetical protein